MDTSYHATTVYALGALMETYPTTLIVFDTKYMYSDRAKDFA